MKSKLSIKEITDTINNSKYGEYDQYHDWSPSYSLLEKLQMVAKLIENAETIETDGKKLLLQYLSVLKNENRSEANRIMELYKKIEEF